MRSGCGDLNGQNMWALRGWMDGRTVDDNDGDDDDDMMILARARRRRAQ